MAGIIAACAPVPSGPPRVVVEGDAFSKDVTISGVQIFDNQFFKPDDKAHWYLRSFVNPQAHTAQHQLYAELLFGGRNGGYFASDNHAQPHGVDVLYHEACGPHARGEVCDYEDTIGIDLPEATLRANASQGLDIKVTARSGYARVMAITPEMISAQLYATQEILSGKVVVGQTVKSGDTIEAGPPVPMPASTSLPSAAGPINARMADGKPFLGIAPFDLPFGLGVQVNRVDPHTPAKAAGFQIGDLLLRYNGQPVTSAQQVRALILQTKPGSIVPVEIERQQRPMTISVQM
ncbi:MAG TPA: PDZ domain-containing protein [Stellaceae bacterium]|nr:PDZ domain-containing protein [Stellaceae bacterium]